MFLALLLSLLALAGAVLPEVAYQAPAAYPPEAQAAGEEAVVQLELGIDERGIVIEARLVEPVGDGFDEAALLAARATRFTPARDESGAAVSAAIFYNIAFSLEKIPSPSLRGQVREAGTRLPLPGVELRATGPEDALALATTDEDGRYTFVGLGGGSWTLAATDPRHRTLTEEVEIRAEELVELDLALVKDAIATERLADEILVVEGERATSEAQERRLPVEEIQYLPGTNGDVVKVVQNLPGVARSPLGTGNLIIRGTAPEDSRTFIDGSPIPLVFHFAGLTAVINSDSISEVAYLPGNFSVRYGRILGGLVDLRTKTELPERSRGYLSVDVFQTALYQDIKLGPRTALSFSGRRSYVDAVLSPLLSKGNATVRAPRYYDAQLRFLHQTDGGTSYDALFFLSDDRFRFLGGEEDPDEVVLSYADRFQRLRLRRLAPLAGGWTEETTLGIGPEKRDFSFGTASAAYEKRFTFSLREEVGIELAPNRPLAGRVGLDLLTGRDAFLFNESRFASKEEGASTFLAPGLYGELSGRAGRLTLIPGLRFDALLYGDGYAASALDPRFTSRLLVGRDTTLKASVGRFSAQPSLRQVDPGGDGTRDLSFPWSLQSSVGIEQPITGRVNADLTAYYNRLYDRVVGREDRLRFYSGPPPVGPFDTEPYANEGTGFICGVEGQLSYRSPTSVGLLSFTLSHSERQDRPDEPVELFEYDQPVVLNALWSQRLPKDWRLGGRIRYSSGNPYTPVENRIQDMGSRSFAPVYGERSSARIRPFTSLDLRVDKTITFRRWSLEVYMDVQNITPGENVEVIGWTYDYGELDPISSTPPLPVFGLKGSW